MEAYLPLMFLPRPEYRQVLRVCSACRQTRNVEGKFGCYGEQSDPEAVQRNSFGILSKIEQRDEPQTAFDPMASQPKHEAKTWSEVSKDSDLGVRNEPNEKNRARSQDFRVAKR